MAKKPRGCSCTQPFNYNVLTTGINNTACGSQHNIQNFLNRIAPALNNIYKVIAGDEGVRDGSILHMQGLIGDRVTFVPALEALTCHTIVQKE